MSDAARAVLRELQDAITARDLDRLAALFDEQAVLIGTTADARDRDAVLAYAAAVIDQDEELRWEYDDVVTFYREGDTIGFAGFGELVYGDQRSPFRVTIVAVGGRIRQFHGSIPAA